LWEGRHGSACLRSTYALPAPVARSNSVLQKHGCYRIIPIFLWQTCSRSAKTGAEYARPSKVRGHMSTAEENFILSRECVHRARVVNEQNQATFWPGFMVNHTYQIMTH
jgi:hypothetical protein